MTLHSPKSWFYISTCISYPLSLKSAIPYFVLSLPLFFSESIVFTCCTQFLIFPWGAYRSLNHYDFIIHCFTCLDKNFSLPTQSCSSNACILSAEAVWSMFIILPLVLALFWLSSLTTLQNFTLTVLSKISLSYVNWE